MVKFYIGKVENRSGSVRIVYSGPYIRDAEQAVEKHENRYGSIGWTEETAGTKHPDWNMARKDRIARNRRKRLEAKGVYSDAMLDSIYPGN